MCYSRNKGKHLTLQDRNDILSCLQRNLKFIEIAHYIHCSPRTISKEIQRSRILKTTSSSNQCIHRFSCHIIGLCGFCLNKECCFSKKLGYPIQYCPHCNHGDFIPKDVYCQLKGLPLDD